MKAVVVKLSEEEAKVVNPVVDRLKDARKAFETASRAIRNGEGDLWELLDGFHPKGEDSRDRSFDYESNEIRYAVRSRSEQCRDEKHKAVVRGDLELASVWRDREREARDKEGA